MTIPQDVAAPELCASPIFIIGSPRSGTTALGWALAEHSQLWTSPESQILVDLFGGGQLDKNYQRAERPGSWLVRQGIAKDEFLQFVGIGFNALFTRLSQGKRWIDHTPYHTLMVADLAAMFPGALFLHMLRDGRRVVHSMINRKVEVTWRDDFAGACATWRRYVEAALEAQARYPTRCLTVKNEDLCLRPESSFRAIFSFLGIDEEPAPATFFHTQRINSSFSKAQRDEATNMILSRPWPGWSGEQRRVFLAEAGDLMIKCGFATEAELSFRSVVAHIPDA